MRVQKRKTPSARMVRQILLHRVWLQFGQHLKDPVSGDDLTPETPIHFDHIHGRQFGGRHEYENYQPLVIPTHHKKSAREARDAAHVRRLRNGKKRSRSASRKIRSRGFDKTKTKHFDGTVTERVS